MRFVIFLVLELFALSLTSQAQKAKENDTDPFGKVDKSLLEMKACTFDRDAEALMLFETGNLICDFMGHIQLEIHVRVKVLKEKGLERANIRIPFYSYHDEEAVRKIAAKTYNLDTSSNMVITDLDPKSIFIKVLNKRFSEVVLAIPQVRIGSVFEYKYTIEGTGLRTWFFQRSIPVAYSRFRVDFPAEVELSMVPKCILPLQKEELIRNRARVVTQYTMKEVPPLRNEPYMMNEEDYLQRIETRLQAVYRGDGQRVNRTRSWQGVIRMLMEDDDFGSQLKKNIPRTDELDKALLTVTDPFQRMKTIHHYVRSNMEWNGYTSIWALDGVKSAWKDKKGTSGEINLILVNLLKEAGLNACPILVSTHDNGLINTFVADYTQFNKVLAYVLIDNSPYVLDATDKYTPTHLVPEEVNLTQGLVLEKWETFQWGWKTIWSEGASRKNMIMLRGTIGKDGLMSGHAYISSQDYERLGRIPWLKKEKTEYIKEFFSAGNPDVAVTDLDFQNEANDSLPLIQQFNFTYPLQKSGDYQHFSVNIFTGLEKNPFLAEKRFSDVFFGMNQSYTIVGTFVIPDDAKIEELPRNIRMILPDSSIAMTRVTEAENNTISTRITLEFRKPYYTTEEYPAFREFYKKLFQLLNEQIVYTRKSFPEP